MWRKIKNLLINTDFSSRACKKLIMLSSHYHHNLWSSSLLSWLLTAIFYGPNQKLINCGQFKVHSMTVYLSYFIRKILSFVICYCYLINNYWVRLSKITGFVSGKKHQIIIIDLQHTDKSQSFVITKFNSCLVIWSPSLFFNEYLLEAMGSAIPLKSGHKKEKRVVSFTHEQNIICRQQGWTALGMSIPLFIGMKKEKIASIDNNIYYWLCIVKFANFRYFTSDLKLRKATSLFVPPLFENKTN